MFFCLSLVLFSCKNETAKNDAQAVLSAVSDTTVVDMHNSQNALDWQGTYKEIGRAHV